MLPRVAPTTGISQPSPQAGAAADAAVKPQPSAAAIANLRAEVLLRLIETMLKHMPRTAEPDPGRNLLETLLSALKTLPGSEGERARKLADIIARLPPELRPSVEKLMGTVLSAVPTRSLVEIVRNPNGPDALKLAALLSAGLQPDDLPGAERQARPVGLTAQQLAAVGRHGAQQAGQVPGDARILQTALKRLFDLDGGGKPRPAGDGAASAGADRSTVETSSAARPPTLAARASDQRPVDAAQAAIRHQGGAEEIETTPPIPKHEEVSAKGQIADPAGRALARGVLEAVARDAPSAQLMQAVAQLMENLSPEEATILKALLERPLDPAIEQELALMVGEHAEDGEAPAIAAEKARSETAQQAALQRPAAQEDEALPLPQARNAALPAAVAEVLPDRLPPAAILRDGVPLAFVPYLPAEQEVAWPESREAEEEEEASGDEPDGDESEGEADAEPDGGEGEPESADMARRREKTAEMVGVIEPGLVFYQKLGDYWT